MMRWIRNSAGKSGSYFLHRLSALVLSAVCCTVWTACASEDASGSLSGSPDATEPALELRDDAAMFETYVSNTVVATGNNTIVPSADHITYRAWLPVECSGSLEYCFYFSNTVDSTWDDGSLSHAGMSGGSYTIESASISDGGTEFDANVQPTQTATITFDGETQKDVSPDETFWSDPVTFDVPDGHYLLWEWTISGENIPGIAMSNMTYSYMDKGDDKGFLYTNEIPLPQMFGCKRDVETRIVTLGDSVTQGSLTSDFAYQFWASQLLNMLGTESYSLWNLGLGYAHATDCAMDGDWLSRAVAGADLITIAFGTNDIISGAYGADGSSSAEEIEAAVRTITSRCTDAGIETILWNSPPFDLIESMEQIRTAYNETVPVIAEDYGATYFDAASLLADPSDASKTIYGQHPNDEGGKILAQALAACIEDMQQNAS